jgi:hypothetical protein
VNLQPIDRSEHLSHHARKRERDNDGRLV